MFDDTFEQPEKNINMNAVEMTNAKNLAIVLFDISHLLSSMMQALGRKFKALRLKLS